jgi:hypothetical protein
VSGWIKFEKDLQIDPRVIRMAKAIDRKLIAFRGDEPDLDPCNAVALPAVTLVCGALVRLWCLADSHVGEDDILDLSAADVDEFLGLPGFCELAPSDWLVVDGDRVKLPGFHRHNGTEAKKRAVTQKRVAAHRSRNAASVTRPDQDQTKTRPEKGAASPPDLDTVCTQTPGLDVASFRRWVGYRKELGKALRPQSLAAAATALAKHGAAQAAVVEQSIANGWQGLFELRAKGGGQPQPPVSAVDRVRQATGVDLRRLTGASHD